MNLSEAGVRFIARFEGYRRYCYNDPAGHATIGYGHLLHFGPVTLTDRLRYPLGLTQAQALKLLRRDAATAERAVHTLVLAHRELGQGQYDALCSFTFNCGAGALGHSTLLADVLRKLGPDGAAVLEADFRRWNHAGGREIPGLTIRRGREARLFLQGDYGFPV